MRTPATTTPTIEILIANPPFAPNATLPAEFVDWVAPEAAAEFAAEFADEDPATATGLVAEGVFVVDDAAEPELVVEEVAFEVDETSLLLLVAAGAV